MDGDEVGVDEGVFTALIALYVVFEVVGAGSVGVARVLKGGVGSVAEFPAVFIAVSGSVVDVDGEGFATFEGVNTRVEVGHRLRVDGYDYSVARHALLAYAGVLHLYHILVFCKGVGCSLNGRSSFAKGLPGEFVVFVCSVSVGCVECDGVDIAQDGVLAKIGDGGVDRRNTGQRIPHAVELIVDFHMDSEVTSGVG